jgi:hypothetical protein
MQAKELIQKLQIAFGGQVELPIAFWYSDIPEPAPQRVNGCYFKALAETRKGTPVTLDAETIGCTGGKFFTGFTEFPEKTIPNFVSGKEKYKKTPEMVAEFALGIGHPLAEKTYLHFARIDSLDTLDHAEGLIFFATPDILTGLITWAFFDTNEPDAISTPFGSGCSSTVSRVVAENRKKGKRIFLGLFDPSVRPYVEANVLSLSIPMSRMQEMYQTFEASSLVDTHAWNKVRERIHERV